MTSSRETILCRYHYDPLDRLISHELSEISERQRFYCKSRLATEIQGAIHNIIIQHDDQLLAQQRSEGDASDTTLLVTDQQRSVLQTLKANHSRQPITYSPYGHRAVESALLSLLGFNGERPDSVTGQYLLGNGYRAFNPVLMRFNSPDSLSPFGNGGLNAYAFCSGDPINFSDPSGRFSLHKLFGWIGRKIFDRKQNVETSNFNAFKNPKPGQYDYIGQHGSGQRYVKSLEKGLDADLLGTNRGQAQGPGFYTTRNPQTAQYYARTAALPASDKPVLFDVFLRRERTDPVKYNNQNYAVPPGVTKTEFEAHYIIHPDRFGDVVVKAIRE